MNSDVPRMYTTKSSIMFDSYFFSVCKDYYLNPKYMYTLQAS